MSTKREIAEAFARQFERVGYDRTTLDDIAAELHISKKTIYVHFDGKRDIYAELVAEMAARNKMELAAAVATLPTYTARVEAHVTSLLRMARGHINETGRDEWFREYEIAADAFREAHGELLRELITAGMKAGEFADGDALFAERMISAMVLDYIVMVREDPSADNDAELVSRIIKFLS